MQQDNTANKNYGSSFSKNMNDPSDETSHLVRNEQDVEESSSSTTRYLGFGFAALLVVVLLGTVANSGSNRTMKGDSGPSRLGYWSEVAPFEVAEFCSSFAEKPATVESYDIIDIDSMGREKDTCTLCYDVASLGYSEFGDCMVSSYSYVDDIPDGILTVTKTVLEGCYEGASFIEEYKRCIQNSSKLWANVCLTNYWEKFMMVCA